MSVKITSGGGTSLANVFTTELDRIFSREGNGFLTQMKPVDLYPMVLYVVSDYVPDRYEEDYERQKINFCPTVFMKKRTTCIYLGSENRRADAAGLSAVRIM
ncbi:MAG: hypothetical protein ACLRIL_07920 [Fusicatenibacter saccharivorans]